MVAWVRDAYDAAVNAERCAPELVEATAPHGWRSWIAALTGAVWRGAALDARGLAVLRIGLAAVILGDLGFRLRDFAAHYTDAGALPRATVEGVAWPFRLYFLGGGAVLPAALFALTALAATALLLGWRTRLATLGCWYLLRCLHDRNPLVLNAGDTLLRVLLFWSLFLPLGRAWALDARRSARAMGPVLVAGWAAVALHVQLAIVYLDTGIRKLMERDWGRGVAVHEALGADYLVSDLGRWLYHHGTLLMGLTYATLVLELLGPQALLLYGRNARVRFVLCATFILFHLGLGLALQLGVFSPVCMIVWLALMPPAFWGWWRKGPGGPEELVWPSGPGRWLDGLAGGLAVLMVVVSLATALGATGAWSRVPVRALGLQSVWKMFVRVSRHSETLTTVGFTAAGTEIPLLIAGSPKEQIRSELTPAMTADKRWSKYLTRVRLKSEYVAPFLAYACRTWAASQGVSRVELREVVERIDDDYRRGAPRRRVLGSASCGAL
jgi:hypothetical protein